MSGRNLGPTGQATQERADNVIYLRSAVAELRERARRGDLTTPADRRALIEDWRRVTRFIDAFGESLGVSPSLDPLAEKVERLAADADEIERRRNDPPGSAGAERARPRPVRDAPPDAKFKLVPFEDIHFDAAEEWLVKKLIPQQGVGVVYGAPRSFKSFVAMDLALHLALGWDWASPATTQGDVVYIAAENVKGIRKRKLGFEMAHDAILRGRVPFYLIEVAPNLGTEKNDLDALVMSVEAVGVRPRLIVIDTLAQTLFGGEENGAGMQTFVANATALANHFAACVLAVHHVPLADDGRLRGHGSLHGGADAELLTERSGGELTVVVTLKKLKDEEDGIKLTVRLNRIVIAQDEDGDEISTLVVDSIEQGVEAAKGKVAKTIPRAVAFSWTWSSKPSTRPVRIAARSLMGR